MWISLGTIVPSYLSCQCHPQGPNNTTLWILYIHYILLQHVSTAFYSHLQAVLQTHKKSMNIDHLNHIHCASTCFKLHHSLSTTQGCFDKHDIYKHNNVSQQHIMILFSFNPFYRYYYYYYPNIWNNNQVTKTL